MSAGVERGTRWHRVARALRAPGPHLDGAALCSSCRHLLSVVGAGITVFADGQQRLVWVSDETTAGLEELQFTIGEGPAVDAFRAGVAVFEADLTDNGPARWLAFGRSAVEVGIRAVFSFPLQVGAARLGALTLYQDRTGRLTFDQDADGLVAAEVVTQTILAQQASAGPDRVAEALDDGANRAEVHQASGMISVQLGIGIVEALVRLRSHAYAADRPIGEVAADVVGRRLRLDH